MGVGNFTCLVYIIGFSFFFSWQRSWLVLFCFLNSCMEFLPARNPIERQTASVGFLPLVIFHLLEESISGRITEPGCVIGPFFYASWILCRYLGWQKQGCQSVRILGKTFLIKCVDSISTTMLLYLACIWSTGEHFYNFVLCAIACPLCTFRLSYLQFKAIFHAVLQPSPALSHFLFFSCSLFESNDSKLCFLLNSHHVMTQVT